MRNFRNNRRRFRTNSFDRNTKLNSNDQNVNVSLGNISDIRRRNYPRNNFNSSKLVQKYSDLAREALSSGDKILYENYLQHAEHFIRLSDNFTENSNSKDNSSKIANEVSINNVSEQSSNQEEKLKVKET
tara:strand:+ start:463 stop:852 length:390 start_codon:yes stop_codon:yes gene_type:complete